MKVCYNLYVPAKQVHLITNLYIMQIGKMKFSEEVYKEIIEETRELLIELNQEHLVNWSEY